MAPVPRGYMKRGAPPKRAAVMILLRPDSRGQLHIVLTLRQPQLRGHAGQVSFPGGAQESVDSDLQATAARETCEEIGICGDSLRPLGCLPRLYIPASNYEVTPIVASCPPEACFAPNPDEVAEVFCFALEDMLRDSFKRDERRTIRGHDVFVPYYAVAGHKVWGATAMLLSECEARLKRVMREEELSRL